MKQSYLIGAAFSFALLFSACQSNEKKHQDLEVKVAHPMHMSTQEKLDVVVVNELDPICQMKTAEHLSDTVTYEGKLYGFCSTSCKNTFLKEPKKYSHD